MSDDNKRNEIGAAWLKTSQNGNEYISVQIKPEALTSFDLANCFISMMVNRRKTKPNQPDYVLTAKPKNQNGQVQPQKPQQAKSSFPRPQNYAPKGDSGGTWDPDDTF